MQLAAVSLVAAGVTFGVLVLVRGWRTAEADPLLREGWTRRAFTAEECAMVGGMIRAWARSAPNDIERLAKDPMFARSVRVTAEEIALHRAWVAWEAEQAEKWVAAGCPDDGVRGSYAKEGEPRSEQWRLLVYGTAQEWAEATGYPLSYDPGPSPFRYPWE